MTIRSKLTFQFSFIVASILMLFSVAVYFFSAQYREQEFYKRLRAKALTTAKLLIQVKEVDQNLLKIIDRNTINALYHEKIVIYSHSNKPIYNSLDEEDSIVVSNDLLKRIRLEGSVTYTQAESEVIGVLFRNKDHQFVIIASAYDKYGLSKLRNLKIVLLIGLVASVSLTIIVGLFFTDKALSFVSRIVREVDKISASNLNSRIDEGNGKDEIAQLAQTFNRMLERLEEAFQMQKSFVSNASHELRTPLASIISQIEVGVMKKREPDEYEEVLYSVLEDTKNLAVLSNGLLELAQSNIDFAKITLEDVRLDELLLQSQLDALKRNNKYVVNFIFEEGVDFNEDKLIIKGNENLLRTVFINLIDNGCKFSKNLKVLVKISFSSRKLHIKFIDEGIGIPDEDLKYIFQPFYRAANAKFMKGHGIGLSLSERIIKMHQGKIKVKTKLNGGTTIEVIFPSQLKD